MGNWRERKSNRKRRRRKYGSFGFNLLTNFVTFNFNSMIHSTWCASGFLISSKWKEKEKKKNNTKHFSAVLAGCGSICIDPLLLLSFFFLSQKKKTILLNQEHWKCIEKRNEWRWGGVKLVVNERENFTHCFFFLHHLYAQLWFFNRTPALFISLERQHYSMLCVCVCLFKFAGTMAKFHLQAFGRSRSRAQFITRIFDCHLVNRD